MQVTWNDEYDRNELARQIEQHRQVDGNGKVSFTGFEFSEFMTVLYSMLQFPADIPETEKRSFIWQALIKAGEKGTITAKSLLIEINRATSAYLRKPFVRYILVTTLSIPRDIALPTIRLGETVITFRGNPNRLFSKARDSIEPKAIPLLFTDIPNNYIYVKVSVVARSADEAADKALNSLDFVRGTWNWMENRRHGMRTTFGKRKPINKIVLGPIHTIHYPDGKLATETWWYEAKRFDNLDPWNITKEEKNLYKFLHNVRIKIAKCKYGKEIQLAIINYTRALDEWDWDGAFLNLWSVLEQLTNRDKSYDLTIKRVSYLYEDRNLSQQVLRHLKDHRNRLVHESTDSSEIEMYIYQLKRYVEHLLSFHLGNRYGFQSIEDTIKFLNLPYDKEEISDRISMLKYSQKYHKYV